MNALLQLETLSPDAEDLVEHIVEAATEGGRDGLPSVMEASRASGSSSVPARFGGAAIDFEDESTDAGEETSPEPSSNLRREADSRRQRRVR